MIVVFIASGGVAVASEVVPDEIAGYTKAEFVSAAVGADVPEQIAEAAWGDEKAMMKVPVSTRAYPLVEKYQASNPARVAAATWITRSGTCYKEKRNIFNSILWKMSVKKTWKTNQGLGAVQAVSANIDTELGWGWYYKGLVNKSDAYSGTSHLSVRSSNFGNDIPESYTITVTVRARGNLNGTISCS